MTEFKLNLPEDEMRTLMSQSILQALSAGARERIIAQAIEWLTTPQQPASYSAFSKPQSPLEGAFRLAMEAATREVVREMIASDEEVGGFVRTELRKLVREYAVQLDEEHDAYGELRAVMTNAMIEHLANKRAEGYR